MPIREWKTLSSSTAYEDHYIRIRKDHAINPGGKEQSYAVLEMGDAVVIIAQDSDGSIYLLQEYRYPIKETVWQLPAGRAEERLNHLDNAKKELKEETGMNATTWKHLGSSYLHASIETTQGHIYLAQGLDKTRFGLEQQEDNELILQVEKFPIEKIKHMIRSNQIKCSWTLAALNLFFLHEEKH